MYRLRVSRQCLTNFRDDNPISAVTAEIKDIKFTGVGVEEQEEIFMSQEFHLLYGLLLIHGCQHKPFPYSLKLLQIQNNKDALLLSTCICVHCTAIEAM